MASSAEIGATGSSYSGNENLGGGSFGVAKLDVRPIEDLAKYTFLYNKSQYDQRQINADEKIKQIAEMTAFDPNTAIDNDKAKAKELYDQLVEYGTEYSRNTPKNSSEKVTQYWDYQKKIATTQKAINSIKGRAISYNKRMDDIEKDTTLSEAQKAVKRKAVIKAANTDIYTPIPLEDKFDEKIPEIAAAVPRELEFSSKLPNDNVSHKVKMVTSTDLLKQSQAESTGLETAFNGPHKDFFNASDNPFRIYHDSAAAYNAAIADPNYQKRDAAGNVVLDAAGKPIIDYDAIKQYNPTLHQVSTLIDDYNTWAADMKEQATQGLFKDRLGKGYGSVTGVGPDDFFTLDKSRPLTGDQIVMLEKWRKSAGKLLTIDETIASTDNAIQGRGQDIQIRGQNITAAHNKAEEAQAWERINLSKKQIGSASNDDVLGADAVLSEVASIIKNREPVKNWLGQTTGYADISDPTLLKEFGSIDKDGKVTNVPDKVRYDDKKGELVLVYQKKDTKGAWTGEEELKPLNARTWLGQKVRQKFPNKDIGSINNIVEQTFKQYGGNLTELSEKYGIGGTGTPPPAQPGTIKIPTGATIGKNK